MSNQEYNIGDIVEFEFTDEDNDFFKGVGKLLVPGVSFENLFGLELIEGIEGDFDRYSDLHIQEEDILSVKK